MDQKRFPFDYGARRAGAVTICGLLLGLSSGAGAKPASADGGLCRRLLNTTVAAVDEHLAIPNDEPWRLTPETEREIQRVFAATATDDATDDSAKIRRVIELMMIDHAASANSKLRTKLFRAALDRAFARDDWYSKTIGRVLNVFEGPHYSYLANRTSIASALDAENPAVAFTYVSLLTQAFDRNFHFKRSVAALVLKGWNNGDLVFRVPLAPLLANRVARSSIGSQWEFARRLPPDVRTQMLRALDEHASARDLPAEDRALFVGLLETGLWDRFVGLVKVMQARGHAARGDVDPISFFGRTRLVEKMQHPLRSIRFARLRTTVARAARRLQPKAREHDADTGYLSLNVDNLRLAKLMEDPSGNRAELTELINARGREPMTEAQRAQVERLARDFSLRDLSDAQKVSELVMTTSLRFAHLPKDEFIRTVEHVYETDVSHLMHEDIVNPFTVMKIAMAIEAAAEFVTGGHHFMARDIGLFRSVLAAFWPNAF